MASHGPRPKSSSTDAWELVTICHHRAENACVNGSLTETAGGAGDEDNSCSTEAAVSLSSSRLESGM